MTKINFQLICSKNPQVVLADDIEQIRCITLENCNIREVSNLELFSHITELNLSRNHLVNIRNLSFFSDLQVLDVSYNQINIEGLQQSLPHLPAALRILNLTGNPCVKNESALDILQGKYPDLAIAIEEVNETESSDAAAPVEESDKPIELTTNSLIDATLMVTSSSEGIKSSPKRTPVDSEDILKEIVDRKCRMQTMATFNLDNAIKVSLD